MPNKTKKEAEQKTIAPIIKSSFDYEHFKSPFFNTNNFDIVYSCFDKSQPLDTKVDGNEIHASLKAASDGYREQYVKLYDSDNARKSLASANLLTGEIGFLYSDNQPDEGYLGDLEFAHFPIAVPYTSAKYTFGVTDFFDDTQNFNADTAYNKSLRNKDFNKQLQQRIDLAKAQAPFHLNTALTGKIHVQSAQFHETYHHTEQGCMHFLDSTSGTKFVVDKILKHNPGYINALFVDLHSTRYMCDNCNIGLIGLQNTQSAGFLKNLQYKLSKSNIESPQEGLTLNTRISADMPANNQLTLVTTRDIKRKPRITPEDKSLIIQGDSGQSKLQTIIAEKKLTLDKFEGDFFSSREISKKKMEGKLHTRNCFAR